MIFRNFVIQIACLFVALLCDCFAAVAVLRCFTARGCKIWSQAYFEILRAEVHKKCAAAAL